MEQLQAHRCRCCCASCKRPQSTSSGRHWQRWRGSGSKEKQTEKKCNDAGEKDVVLATKSSLETTTTFDAESRGHFVSSATESSIFKTNVSQVAAAFAAAAAGDISCILEATCFYLWYI